MKFLAFIMAFFVLALSVLPCTDADAAMKDTKAKTQLTKTAEPQDHEDNENCSPFCHCSCCAGFSMSHTVAALSEVAVCFESHKTSFLPSEVIEIISPIWQPPRLV